LLVDIYFKEGGDDAKHFVSDLAEIYINYCIKNNFSCEVLSNKFGNICLEISGKNVWEHFKTEIGKHQVQRIPPNEKHGRMQTSTVSVSVYKLFEFQNSSLNPNDLEIQTQRGSGPGGQHRNKTDSAVRMKHIPTNITVFIDGRDQSQNKQKALQILTSRVNVFNYEQQKNKHSAHKKEQLFDNRIVRTYNFKANRITDHITGKKSSNIKEIMKGDLNHIKM
jgi:peptide chain release factor 1